MRDKQDKKQGNSDGAREDDTQPAVDVAKRKSAKERKLAGQAKQKLHSHADKVGKAYLLGANLFQMRVRGDAEEVLQKKMEPALAEKLGEKAIEKALDTVKDNLIEITEVGTELAGKMSSVFGAIKTSVTDKIKNQSELTVMQVADQVTAGLIEGQALVEERLHAAIDAIPTDKLAAIAKMLFDLREAAKDDEADSEEHGKLADGMEAWAMTDLLGMPGGDGVAAEKLANDAYEGFRAGVREHAMSASEATTDIQRQLSHPHEDKDKMDKAEEKLGDHTKANIDKDKAMHARVDAAGVTGGGA